jgi:hypothetical protein
MLKLLKKPGQVCLEELLCFYIAQAQLSAIYLMHCTGKGGAWKIIPFCTIAQAQLSAIDSCAVKKRGAALSPSVFLLRRLPPLIMYCTGKGGSFILFCLLRRRSFLSLTHVMYRKGWCLEGLSPSVLLRRRSFLSLTHVLYMKGFSFISFCSIAQAQLSASN